MGTLVLHSGHKWLLRFEGVHSRSKRVALLVKNSMGKHKFCGQIFARAVRIKRTRYRGRQRRRLMIVVVDPFVVIVCDWGRGISIKGGR